jgi:hypothetical protein
MERRPGLFTRDSLERRAAGLAARPRPYVTMPMAIVPT